MLPEQGRLVREHMAQAPRVTEEAEQTVKSKLGLRRRGYEQGSSAEQT